MEHMKQCIRFIAILLLCAAFAAGAQAAQVLEDGASGETVMVLTRRLAELGYIDGSVSEYDADVVSAIADFQTANGLERTGVADIATQQAMNSTEAVTRSEYITDFAAKYVGKSFFSGNSGEDVKRLQTSLKELGYYSYEPDGKFGEGTRRSVVAYQRANGLEPTGIADASMLMRLYEGESISYAEFVNSQCAAKGDSGAKVKSLQQRLNELGYFTGDSTGTYGSNTTRAVTRFQRDNGLTETGSVDSATYEALFAPNAAPAADDGALYAGDTGDQVYAMQQLLKELGYYEAEPDGVYDRATETAVMLFRAANGFVVSPDAGGEVLTILYSDTAKSIAELEGSAAALDADGRQAVCSAARELVGASFAGDDGLFPGYEFVRYVFASCGMAIGDPANAIESLSHAGDTVTDMAPGNILVLGQGDEQTLVMNFAICAGNGTIVYVDGSTGLVAETALESMEYISAYVWDPGL